MTSEIQKEQWKEFFDNLSRDLDGWETDVGVFSNDLGAQMVAEGLPFHGLTAEETSGGEFVIELSVGEGTDSHQTHTIVDPVRVAFQSAGVGPGGVLDIEDASGTKTLVKLIQPFPVLAEYQTMDIVAVASSGE